MQQNVVFVSGSIYILFIVEQVADQVHSASTARECVSAVLIQSVIEQLVVVTANQDSLEQTAHNVCSSISYFFDQITACQFMAVSCGAQCHNMLTTNCVLPIMMVLHLNFLFLIMYLCMLL